MTTEHVVEVTVAPSGQLTALTVAPSELGEPFSALRLCSPEAQQAICASLSQVGQLTAVQAFCCNAGLEVFDGLKRLRPAQSLAWQKLRVDVHDLQSSGAKVRLLWCNASTGLPQLEEAWLVRSLHCEDRLSQSQIAMLLSRHKSWVCRRLALVEGLCDELTASVRLGLIPMRTAVELARLPRGNQAAEANPKVRASNRAQASAPRANRDATMSDSPICSGGYRLVPVDGANRDVVSVRLLVTANEHGDSQISTAWSKAISSAMGDSHDEATNQPDCS